MTVNNLVEKTQNNPNPRFFSVTSLSKKGGLTLLKRNEVIPKTIKLKSFWLKLFKISERLKILN